MKRKGFTLIELLSIIVIIGIISVITTINVFKYISSTRNEINTADKTSIISAAKNWSADHPESLPGENSNITYPLNVSTLIDEGYLSHEANKYEDYCVKISFNDNKYVYLIEYAQMKS